MDALIQFWKNQWTGYPEWLVVSSVAIAGGVALWFFAKLFTWVMKWVLVGMAMVVVVGVILYFVSV